MAFTVNAISDNSIFTAVTTALSTIVDSTTEPSTTVSTTTAKCATATNTALTEISWANVYEEIFSNYIRTIGTASPPQNYDVRASSSEHVPKELDNVR